MLPVGHKPDEDEDGRMVDGPLIIGGVCPGHITRESDEEKAPVLLGVHAVDVLLSDAVATWDADEETEAALTAAMAAAMAAG